MINLNPTVLDITSYPQNTQHSLKQAIFDAVKATQEGFLRTLPDELHMTDEQYKLLQNDPEMLKSNKDRLYYTPFNCMEVIVL